MTPQNDSGDAKQVPARLIELGQAAELFHDADGKAYATVPVDGHRETYLIQSQGFQQWLGHRLWQEDKKTANKPVLQAALDTLISQAIHDGPQRQVGLRLAESDGAIWLDLANDDWQAVRITADGWDVVDSPEVRFRRSRGMKALPVPVKGGSLEELRQLLNIPNDGHWVLVQGYMLAALRPRGPHPVLIVNGEQGSAKSTLCKVIRALIDPNVAPLRAAPHSVRDLMISADNSWLLAFDNLSDIRPWLSDAICRLATGGGLATRQLYTDTDETILNAARPVLMNGIDELAARPDLLSRSICLMLPRIEPSGRITEEQLWQKFDRIRPRVLGALLDAVSRAMRHVRTVSLQSYPRMADFAKWVVAGESALDAKPGAFLAAYEANELDSYVFAVEASPIGGAIQMFMAGRTLWEGAVGELLKQLNMVVDASLTRRYSWPQTAKGMGNALRRLAPSLREACGIDAEFLGKKGKDRLHIVVLEKSDAAPSASPAPPACDPPQQGQQDDETDEGQSGAK